MPACVIVVENLPVPFDRRVWQEAKALSQAGWTVSVICPRSDAYPAAFERLDGIDIHRHPLPFEAKRKAGFLVEYASALWHELRLLVRIWRQGRFDVIQGCNPPDLIFLVALPFKLMGVRYVFDHHDVCPELYEAKFGRRGPLHWVMRTAERLTFMAADLVISANDTYRGLALSRGGKKPDDVVTVYSVPDRSRMRRVAENAELRGGARLVLGYVGIIGEQDGVDHLVRAMHELTTVHGFDDIRAVVVGDGPALAEVRALAESLGLGANIVFTGYLNGEALLAAISTFDIGVIPDPVNEYNDKISMNKVFEYSAFGVPPVAYALTETRRLLGDAGTYADGATPADLARACATLIGDDALRKARGAAARKLADERFDWEREARKLVSAYARFAPAAAVEAQSAARR